MNTLKKSILMMVMTVMGFVAQAGTDVAISASQLPARARQTLSANFPNLKISLAKMEKDMFSLSYDVILTDGTKVEFNKQGEWTSVECCKQSVPAQFVPAQIAALVKRRYGNKRICEIERDKNGYDVRLHDGLELKFNKKMQLVDIDD